MSETNRDNLESRFDAGETVLDYFETDVVLTVDRLAKLAPILNLSAISREAGMNIQTLQAKIRRRTALTGDETRRIVSVLKRYHLEVDTSVAHPVESRHPKQTTGDRRFGSQAIRTRG